jgi:type IV secretion system protein VirB4
LSFLTAFTDALDFRKFKDSRNRLAYYCPWSIFCGNLDEGIVLLKGGALMRCYSYICPDLGSASVDSIAAVSWYFNETVKSMGGGWCAHFESQRGLTTEYPGSSWSNIAGYLIDRKRKETYTLMDAHFVNQYYLTLTKKLPSSIYSKVNKLLYKSNSSEGGDGYYNREIIKKEIQNFRSQCEAVISHLASRISITPMDDSQTATYLHSSVSTNFNSIEAMLRPVFIDSFITDESLDIATTLKLGNLYIPIIGIKNFPQNTYPAILSQLNASEVEYRWSIRWIARDKQDAGKDIEKYQKRFYGSRKTWGTAIFEVAANVESGREDPAAIAFEQDTNTAKVELATDEYSFGYFTASMMVWDEDYDTAIDKARYISAMLNSSGFESAVETHNAFNAFLGMMPGNYYSNVKQPILSSGNLTHIISLSSIWSGVRENAFTSERFGCLTPLLVCSTESKIPFFLNLNVGDLGHTFVFGPPGAGKSTLLCLLESQFLKYKNANVVIFDKDKSARSITMAAGGVYEEPGGSNVAFQPLRNLETETELLWAAEFISVLLEMQHIQSNPVMSEAVLDALKLMRQEKEPDQRTISTFQQYVNYVDSSSGELTVRVGVQPYTINGQYGLIFDASNTSLSLSKWIMIEMGTLMKMGPAAVTPALMFLFHFVEKLYTNANGDPTGDPTILVLDEAWVYLNNAYFSRTMEEWLTTLRKKNVFCVFATQEVSKAATSSISTAIASMCLTKIYLADPNSMTKIVQDYYYQFGLEENEILAVSRAVMKRDYFYKSPLGARMFQLNLDKFQLALLSPNHDLLDGLEAEYGRNSRKPLAAEILKRKGITEYSKYLSREARHA